MDSIIEFLKDIPPISPIIALILLVVIPTFAFLIAFNLCPASAEYVTYNALWKFAEDNSFKLLFVNSLATFLLVINQIIFIQQENVDMGLDISYYLRVNLNEYDSTIAIDQASSLNSFNKVEYQNIRRLSSSNWIVIIYHTSK